MTGFIIDFDNTEYRLPEILSWEICHSWGLPTDSFQIALSYSDNVASILPGAVRFRATFQGKTVFTGIVDEYEINFTDTQSVIVISGRGLGGLLTDNQCQKAEYSFCGIRDVLAKYVYPLGIRTEVCDDMPYLTGFTVGSGTSCWNALEQFSRFAAGITPMFSCNGGLILSKRGTGKSIIFDGQHITELRVLARRYGVISEVLVIDADGRSQIVYNDSTAIKGSLARRVISVPRKTTWDAMRYTAKYQIDNSQKDNFTVEISVVEPFAALPGDTVYLNVLPEIDGEYFVLESISSANGDSTGTVLSLVKKEN